MSDVTGPVKLSLPLEKEFQQDIFHQVRKEDELLIIAKGLGLLRLVNNLLHSYDAAGGNLIIVVGAEDQENDWIGQFLAEQAAVSAAPNARGLSLVNTHMSNVSSRQKLYASGGILSITSQILVVDLLSGALEPSTITGLVVLHAERVTAVSVEAFILRIYRQQNTAGFLKAFSDSPGSFTTGFAPLSNMLRNLFLRKPLLYPRFQVDVAKSLEGRRKAEVIELEIELSDSMSTIQAAIMDCVEASIGELKKGSTGLDVADWNLDNALHLDFDTIVMNQLRPVWHRLHPKVKQIAGDLRTLRTMLSYLVTRDAIEFCKYLDLTVAASQSKSARMNQSPWLFLDAAHTVIETARHRVYAGKISDAPGHQMDEIRPVLEELPKWSVLGDILEEIERHLYTNLVRDDSSGAILIMCEDNATCAQLRDYIKSRDAETSPDSELQHTASAMMTRKLKHYIQWKKNISKFSAMVNSETQKPSESTRESQGRAPPNKRRRVRGASAIASNPGRDGRPAGDKDAHIASLLEESRFRDVAASISDPSNEFGDYYELYEMSDLIVLHPYDGDIDDHVLEEVKPRYVIMYEPDTAFIRRVELYRSSHTNRDVRVYFMYYKNSTEEQKYLSAVRKEKDSFTKLIRERGSMSVLIDNAKLDPEEAFLRTVNTRIAGGGRLAATSVKPRVVVDIREFRSSLPSLVHARGMDIVPCLLTIGDYVLTPSICVERKSISDLISSFSSGRLFNQVETMMEHYKNPMLLIEFDQSKSFTLEPFSDMQAPASAISSAPDLQSKIVLLTLAFPRLRIIWSSSPYQTAEIYEELKKNDEEPDPRKAAGLGAEGGEDEAGRTFNQTSMDMLREVPGINEKNIVSASLEVESLHSLANMDEDGICAVVGKATGREIYRFFNRNLSQD